MRSSVALPVFLSFLLFPWVTSCPYSEELCIDVQLIVSFHKYKMTSEHVCSVREALGSQIRWEEKPRRNKVTALKTDFVVIGVQNGSVDEARRMLLGADEVKRVHRQSHYRRAVLTEFEKSEGPLPTLRNEGVEGAVQSALPINETGRSARDKGLPMPDVDLFGAAELWKMGFHGSGVRVAVFDTGLGADNPHFANIVERTDWTEEGVFEDKVGHGTFVAGLIAGKHPLCPGLARDAEIITFRVFTDEQTSYTSWFLDAFNYALHANIDVLNLSIGGPDFADEPFTEKINELAAAGVIVVSAIGNDGPQWGSLNNPADMMEVIGVGGVEPNGNIAPFSSRGMTSHELGVLYESYGRVKPDIVAYGRSLTGPSSTNFQRCKRLSGTSVAAPAVAGAIALIASTIPLERRRAVVNPASVKQALLRGAKRLPRFSIYEQGSGLLDIPEAARAMKVIDQRFLESRKRPGSLPIRRSILNLTTHSPRSNLEARTEWSVRLGYEEQNSQGLSAFLYPAVLDLSTRDCSYMWPHCAQPLYADSVPLVLNVTIFSPGGVKGAVESVEWIPGINGNQLDVNVTIPQRFWPWAAGLGVHLRALSRTFGGVAEGKLRIRVKSVFEGIVTTAELLLRADVIPTPRREKRILFDTFHSLRYPPAYVPRDSLLDGKDMLDWLGDHPHTNFHALFRRLRIDGFYVEILSTPITCLSEDTPRKYGALLLLDSEDFFSPPEIRILSRFVKLGSLSLVVAAEWHNNDIMQDVSFQDDNTRSWWTPVVGGANVPAINDLLRPYGVAFGNKVLTGEVTLDSRSFSYVSGTNIVQFPRGGEVLYGSKLVARKPKKDSRDAKNELQDLPLLGITKSGLGVVAAYGDTSCIDTTDVGKRCYEVFTSILSHSIRMSSSVTYEKRFRETVILESSLVPGAKIGERASHPSASILELFRPHSRTLKVASSSAAGERWSSHLTCTRFRALQQRVNKSSERLTTRLSWPRVEYASPVGSADAYYKPLRRGSGLSNFNLGLGQRYISNQLSLAVSGNSALLQSRDSLNILRRFLMGGMLLIVCALTLYRTRRVHGNNVKSVGTRRRVGLNPTAGRCRASSSSKVARRPPRR